MTLTGAGSSGGGVAGETITATTPGTLVASASYTQAGTYTNGPPAALDYSFDGTGCASSASSPTISGGNYSFTNTAPAAGTHTITVCDHANHAIFGTSGNFTSTAAKYQGDLQAGATEWHGIVTAYTQAYATPGTNVFGTLTRLSDSHSCGLFITSAAGAGLTTSCSTGGDNGQTAATWLTATTAMVVPLDQTGNGNDAAACPGGANGVAPGFGTTTLGAATTYVNYFATASKQCFTTALTNFGSASGTIVWWQYNLDASNSGVINAMWGQSSDGSHTFSCQHYSDNNIYCGWDNPTDNRVVLAASSGNWPTATWTLYALRWDASKTELLVNGSVVGTKTATPGAGNLASAMRIGDTGKDFVGGYNHGNLKTWGYWPNVSISDSVLAAMFAAGVQP